MTTNAFRGGRVAAISPRRKKRFTTSEHALEQSGPFFANLQHCYLHAKDAWVEQARIYRFSMSTRSAHALESPESLLGMLDFLPKPKGFRKMLPSQKDLRKMYEGKL